MSTIKIFGRLSETFDPTDANASMEVAEAALRLASTVEFATRTKSILGRDLSGDLSVRTLELGEKLGLLSLRDTKTITDFMEELKELY